MTPETARALEPGTTPGPWNVYSFEALGGRITTEIGPIAPRCSCDGLECGEADSRLIAAAPDMRATIAAQTWEWGVQVLDHRDWEEVVLEGDETYWTWEEEARHHYEILTSDFKNKTFRLVRRPVGPMEVVE